MDKFIILTPAYGRDYQTAEHARQDFDDNKDFIFNDITNPYDGKYINKDQIDDHTNIKIRFKKLTHILVFEHVKYPVKS